MLRVARLPADDDVAPRAAPNADGGAQSFEKLLAHIAPETVNNLLKEAEIAGAMQMYNLERAYAVNALTISNELISLRRNHSLDMLQALDLLQQRVSNMRSEPYRPPSAARAGRPAPLGASVAGAGGGGGGGGGPKSPPNQQQQLDDDYHVEKRRRLSKHACPGGGGGGGGVGVGGAAAAAAGGGDGAFAAMAAMAAAGVEAGPGNEENELRPQKRVGGGSVSSSSSGGSGGGGGGGGGGGAGAGGGGAVQAEDIADFKRARK